jgi:cysteine desulfurase
LAPTAPVFAKFGRSLKQLEAAVGCDTLLLPGHDYDDCYACPLKIEIARQPLSAPCLTGTMDAKSFAAAKAVLEGDLAPTEYQTMDCGARVDTCSKVAAAELSLRRTARPGRAG